MIVNRRIDLVVAACEWRGDHGRYPKAEQRGPIHQICVQAIWRDYARWRNVIEEAAPFVESDNHHRAGPLRSTRDCMEHLR